MKLSQAKEFLPIIQAAADGKTIQGKNTTKPGGWEDFGKDEETSLNRPEYYRIKPEETWRQWRPEEVPFGDLIRVAKSDFWHVIVGVHSGHNSFFAGRDFSGNLKWALDECERSSDGGKNWSRCGVKE